MITEVLSPGRGCTYLLESNMQLVVTVNGTGVAQVDRYRRDKLLVQTSVTTAQSFGPYNFDMKMVVNAVGAPVTVVKQEGLQALGTADA